MSAANHDLSIEQGATFFKEVRWTVGGSPVDLTGYIFRGQIRKKATDSEVQASFEFELLDAPQGLFRFGLSAADTSAISASAGVYDVELQSPAGVVTRLMQGKVTVSPEVTR